MISRLPQLYQKTYIIHFSWST